MKTTCLLLLTLALTCNLVSKDFGGFSWGASREEIIAKEGEPKNNFGSSLLYNDQIAGIEVLVLYEFDFDGLKSGIFEYATSQNSKTDEYSLIFESLLTQKYGKPTQGDSRVKVRETSRSFIIHGVSNVVPGETSYLITYARKPKISAEDLEKL